MCGLAGCVRRTIAENQVLVSVRFGNGRLGLAKTVAPFPAGCWGAFASGGLGGLVLQRNGDGAFGESYGIGFGITDGRLRLWRTDHASGLARRQLQIFAAYLKDPGIPGRHPSSSSGSKPSRGSKTRDATPSGG
jgi:hypothetical protein